MTESRYPSATDGHRLSEEHVTELLQLRELTAVLQDENRDLRTALESRVVIEQAKGVLAERLQIDVEEAFSVLRRAARSSRIELRELSARVVSSETTPPELIRTIDRLAEDADDA